MTTWTCYEPGCGAEGLARDRLDALVDFEHHYLDHHYREGEAA